ncbi:uncharacterized protein LOC127796815 [Diospyros lotus]|uniref:uncharacterized protein LOC127796815 n=1 Tax=Diospyros lotus TaxID=55363 RepID=UPI00224CA2AC|nr:uncharacterized protein LOC127796815 [Diospyros lotus]
MSLPRFIAIYSPNRRAYLRYVHEDTADHGFLQFGAPDVATPYTKFEVIRGMGTGNTGLSHIRCCYNNKYWVAWKEDQSWIVGLADEPEEDRSKWSCTLFMPQSELGQPMRFRFTHAQLGRPLLAQNRNGSPLLHAAADSVSAEFVEITDWESMLILPKYVAFKGDNDEYLGQRWVLGNDYLQFRFSNTTDQQVGNEVITTSNGSIRVRSFGNNKFWRHRADWIYAEAEGNVSGNDTLFWPIKIGNDNSTIALRSLGNDRICRRYVLWGRPRLHHALVANVSNITADARIVMEELVLRRQIYDVRFRLADARIYDETIITLANQDLVNGGQEPITAQLRQLYSETRTSTWNNTLAVKLGVSTQLSAGIPSILDGSVTVSYEFSGAYEWGGAIESTKEVEFRQEVTIPPRSTLTARLLATTASCDVPFSYRQRDTRIDGRDEIYELDDGIYSGTNAFNVRFETEQVHEEIINAKNVGDNKLVAESDGV